MNINIKNFIKRLFLLKPTQNFQILFMVNTYNIIFGKYFYRKKYNTLDIITKLKSYGIREGSNIFVHSSWANFYNYTDSPKDFVEALVKLIGPKGTIAMPSYPIISNLKKRIFNVRTTPTGAGIIAEVFRRYPGVIRSSNVLGSVCALGPLADYLIKDNYKSLDIFDESSPYYKIIEKEFTVLCFGLSNAFVSSSNHCIHYIYRHKIPYYCNLYDENHFDEIPYIDFDGNMKTNRYMVQKQFLTFSYFRSKYYLKKYFDNRYHKEGRISNLTINSSNVKYAFETYLDLSKKGKYLFKIKDNKKYAL